MSLPVRLGLFALAVLASFGVGAAVGQAVGPVEVRDQPAEQHAPWSDGHDMEDHGG